MPYIFLAVYAALTIALYIYKPFKAYIRDYDETSAGFGAIGVFIFILLSIA